MSDAQSDLALRAHRRERRRDSAIALAVLGILLLCSPLLDIAAGPARLFGVPRAVVFVFTAWLGLIVFAMRMARILTRADEPG